MCWRSRHRPQPPPRGAPGANFIIRHTHPGASETECMVRHTALGRLFRARAPRFGSQHAAVVPDDVFAYVFSAGSAGRISANLRPFPRQILLDLQICSSQFRPGGQQQLLAGSDPRCVRTSITCTRARAVHACNRKSSSKVAARFKCPRLVQITSNCDQFYYYR
jgi:hypothetical protein